MTHAQEPRPFAAASLSAESDAVAIYVHTPFCPSKCGYCDFNSFALKGDIIERTVRATITEIERSPWRGRPAKTMFFGGGTPTFLSSDQLLQILGAVREVHPFDDSAEVTSEANPCTVTLEKLTAMRRGGFNRLSLGAQSFLKEDLVRLGRVHRGAEVGEAVLAARRAGFENINLDLMFALPAQAMRGWEQNLELALLLKPEHLSLYCLTIEPNTRFHKLNLRGMLEIPDDEVQAAMYDTAVAHASEAGYSVYEISNFAKPGRECRHNLCYWRGEEYVSYGPGAVGCTQSSTEIGSWKRTRYTNMKHPERYCVAIEASQDLWCDSESIDISTHRFERLMLGLRLGEGVDEALVGNANGLRRTIERGWVEQAGGTVRLSGPGRHFCNEVAVDLCG